VTRGGSTGRAFRHDLRQLGGTELANDTPVTTKTRDRVRVAALGDLHCTRASQGNFQSLFARIGDRADVLVLCGDLTDYGLPEEARILGRELIAAGLKIPIVAVFGNHDFESGSAHEIEQILADAGVTVLDGEAREIHGVGFAGVKGFAGGFGERALQSWGEEIVKLFVREALEEALKLESALARLRTRHRVAVLHYAPVQATVEGEPPEIFPFLGSSRLEEPLNRYRVAAVFHGHAHRGRPEGRTAGGVPVYNVALPLLRQTFPEQAPFRVIELPIAPEEAARGASAPPEESAPVTRAEASVPA
jgi:Icc-related predicted phosphoesterase